MSASTVTRINSAPPAITLGGGVMQMAIELKGTYDDPTVSLSQNSTHAGQTNIFAIAPTSSFAASNNSSVSAVPTLHNSFFVGEVGYLANTQNGANQLTIQGEDKLAGTGISLRYGNRNLTPGMVMPMMLLGLGAATAVWREIGNLDDQAQNGITAFAGGGQTGAKLLDNKFNVVDTVASPGDSVKLWPLATNRMRRPQWTLNTGANPLIIYPPSAGNFAGFPVNAGISVAPGQTIWTMDVVGVTTAFMLSPLDPPSYIPANVTSDTNQSITAAQIFNGLIVRTGMSSTHIDTFPAASTIVNSAQFPITSYAYGFSIANLTGQILSLNSSVGVTVSSAASSVAASTQVFFQAKLNNVIASSAAVTITRLYSLPVNP